MNLLIFSVLLRNCEVVDLVPVLCNIEFSFHHFCLLFISWQTLRERTTHIGCLSCDVILRVGRELSLWMEEERETVNVFIVVQLSSTSRCD